MVNKSHGKFTEVKKFGVAKSEAEADKLFQEAQLWLRTHDGQQGLDFDDRLGKELEETARSEKNRLYRGGERSACYTPNQDTEDVGGAREEDKKHHTARRRHMAVRLLDENLCWLHLFGNRSSCTCPVVEVMHVLREYFQGTPLAYQSEC